MTGHEVLLQLAGGVALLLWAARMVRTGILRAFSGPLRRFLGQATRSHLAAFATGLGVTGLLQSSTATALMTSGFAARGLVTTAAGLAIMLGADVGSTLVVQVLSFDISALYPLLLLAGVVGFLSTQATRPRQLGRISIGFGLLLLSLELIVEASAPLRDSPALAAVLDPLARDPILALVLGAALTWLAHSSVATVLLVMSLALTGVVGPALGFALVLGANVGSGLIPVGLTLGAEPPARRIPVGNLGFRLIGAVACLPLLGMLVSLVAAVEMSAARQIANFHTLFNLALALVFLPLVGIMARACQRLFPERPVHGEAPEGQPRHLDDTAVDTPAVALAAATREVMRMADLVEQMLRDTIEVFRGDDAELLDITSKRDDAVDRLHEEIKLYLTEVSRHIQDEGDSRRCIELIQFTTNLEHMGDIIDKNLLEIAQKKIKNAQQFSPEGWQDLVEMHGGVMANMQLAMSVFVSGDVGTARELLIEKERIRDFERLAAQRHLERLRAGQTASVETSALHLDILRDLKRINSHLSAVAYPLLQASGELRRTRLKTASG